ncbi:MAG: hypothetical protein B7Y78_05955, partial [Caulobacter sp. 35-67-4]
MPQTLDLFPIGNCAVSALIDRAGRFVWACAPRVDSDPVFSALLSDVEPQGSGATGVWDVDVEDSVSTTQAYLRNTPILRTEITDADGARIEIIDFALKHGHNIRDPLADKHPWYVLMEVSSQQDQGLRDEVEQFLADAIEQELVIDATLAANLDQAKAFWHLRHTLTEVQKPEGGSIKHDVSVPVAAVPAFLEEASAAVKAFIPGSRPVPFGHVGDGNMHFNVSQPVGADTGEFLARWT